MTSSPLQSRLRSDSASSTGSRNDLFSTSYQGGPVPRPPKALKHDCSPAAGESGADGVGVGVRSGWATSMRENQGNELGTATVSRLRMRGEGSPSSSSFKGVSSRTTSPTQTPYVDVDLSNGPISKTVNFFTSTMDSPLPPSFKKSAQTPNFQNLAPAPIMTSGGGGMRFQGAAANGLGVGTCQNMMSPISPIRLSPIPPPPIPPSLNRIEVDMGDLNDRGLTVGIGRYARVVRGRYRRLEDRGEGAGARTPNERAEEEWERCAIKIPLFDDVLSTDMIEKEARILAHLHELSETSQRSVSMDISSRMDTPVRNIEKGKEHVIGFIGLQRLTGFSTSSRDGKTSTNENIAPHKPRSELRYSRSVSDGDPLQTRRLDRKESGQHTRVADIAAQISLNDDDATTFLPCLVLEYVPRVLSTWLQESNRQILGQGRWRSWAIELVQAVAWCHEKGVLHGDIKPGNVLIDDYENLRLADFGSSVMLSSVATPLSAITLPTMLSLQNASPNLLSLDLGTAPYSAPELFADTTIVSFPSDIFSLGVTLWQLLTLRTPYAGKRTVETMLGVRRGMFWEIHERDRIARLGGGERTMAESEATASVRRSGSHRIPGRERIHRQQLINNDRRMSSRSSESLTELPTLSGQCLWPESGAEVGEVLRTVRTYEDGAPTMWYPNEEDIVEDRTRSLLRSMVLPDPELRPTARDVLDILCN